MAGDSFDRFLQEIRRFLPDWGFIDLRLVAYKGEIGWLYDSVRATLVPMPVKWEGAELPSLDTVFAVQECWPMDRLDDLLTMLRSGELKLRNRTVSVKQYAGSNVWNPASYSHRTYRRREAETHFSLDFTVVALSGYSSESAEEARQYRETIDAELKAADPPWEGIADLRRHFLGLTSEWASNWSSRYAEVLAPLGVRLTGVSTQPRRLQVDLEVLPRVNPADIVVSLFTDSKGKRQRQRKIPKGAPTPDASAPYQLEFALPEEFARVSCSVTYRGTEVDRFERLGSPPKGRYPRPAAFQEIAGSLDSLREPLAQTKGKEFEESVGLLFHLLGFSVGHYGFYNWRTDKPSPDLLAFPDSGNWFLVIEATGREPNLGNKLTKLSTRAKELQRVVEGHLAYPVLVTALGRAIINKSDSETASNELVAIVTADDLSTLVQMVAEGTDPARTRDFLERLIPQSQSGWTPSWPSS